MVTTRGTEASLLAMLENLIELDYDAILAYEAAIGLQLDETIREKLREFQADHARHVRDLGEQVRELGSEPPTEGDYKAALTQGKVAIGGLIGERAVLAAMRSNEDDTNQAYEQAAARPDVQGNEPLLNVLRANLTDERRHRTWLAAQLDRLG